MKSTNKQQTVAFDLDDVLCTRPNNVEHLGPSKYNHCIPIQDNINLLNKYYTQGYYIVIYTARGMTQYNGNVTLIYTHLYNDTITQLNEWGVNFHKLVMGKIHYDILIDDKALNSEQEKLEYKINKILNNE